MRIELSLKSAFAHKDYMQYLVRLFLIRVQRAGTRRAVQKLSVSCVAHRSFVRFRQLLEKHFREIHTVKEYAEMLHVSTRTLSHYVAQSAHLTPLQVINDRVVLEAKRQLQHSTLSIKEIGYQLGFDDPSYFVKFFKRMTGQMPKEFRKDCEVQQRLSASVSSSKITNIMKQKIGIPTADGKLFPHFGKAPHVTVFDVEDEKILNKEVLTAPEHAHGAMPKFLQGLGVTDVICGGLGAGAIQLLEQMAIRIHGGAPADDVDAVVDELRKILPEGPKYFPDDMITDQPERLLVAEIVREKLFRCTRDEVPHAIAVYVEEMKDRGHNKVYIRVTVYVERDSQKRIVIGKNGTVLKEVGNLARQEIENLLGSSVYLDIWVKVKRDWRNKSGALSELGYKNE